MSTQKKKKKRRPPRTPPLSKDPHRLIEEIRESYREWTKMDWPDTLRLTHSWPIEERIALWWEEQECMLQSLPIRELRRRRAAKERHIMEVNDWVREHAPRDS